MNLAKIRAERGFTQAQVAKLVGVDQTTVAKWEAGAAKPRVATLQALGVALKCSIDELLRDSGE